MIGHLSFGVRDLACATAFYDPVMATIGFVRVWSDATAAGYGPPGGDDKLALKLRDGAAPPGAGFHLAFDAADRDAVDRFHAAALAHGGTSDGAPGLRPHYGPTYYAAFVTDPDGYKLEAVHQ
jgi:catechol 2,3-dioxygenase-like lactoylglutathione lyase family enzyme